MSASSSSSLANASGGTASPSSSSSNNKARSPTLALERAKQSLLRELERRRLASTGAGGGAPGTPAAAGSTPLSAGAKLEGLDAIPSSSSSSNGSQGLIRSFLSLFGLGNSSSTSSGIATLSEPIATSSMTGLPSDENEILSTAAEDVFAFEGSADWDKLANAVGGVEIQWKVASVVDGAGERGSEGVRGVYEWVQEL
mgnify:FL=1|jgi:hypothetical protein